jgi:hypothetical protein
MSHTVSAVRGDRKGFTGYLGYLKSMKPLLLLRVWSRFGFGRILLITLLFGRKAGEKRTALIIEVNLLPIQFKRHSFRV